VTDTFAGRPAAERSAEVARAFELLEKNCHEERRYPGSAVAPELVRLNLEHSERVRAAAARIAGGEGLDVHRLELAAALHDIAKLDHREVNSGGLDTWHHHHRGASLARKLVMVDLGRSAADAEAVAQLIESHSDIPFIRRFWRRAYGAAPPSPASPEALALRDADVLDMIWIGGIAKIVAFRQVPGTTFFEEDGGDIRKSIASARTSLFESVDTLSTATGRSLAEPRVAIAESFLARVRNAATLDEFRQVYDVFISSL
jgi:HD superfamily phosphodiesterase